MGEWQALQGWLEAGDRCVTIPYAATLASLVPPIAVRLRRDFGALLNLIRAHALLHRASRERDREGQVIASIEDYARVRELVADLVSEGVEAAVPPTVRETVEALIKLHAAKSEPVTVSALAEELELDKSAAWRRARTATDRGYLKNLEDRKGRPAQLVPGDPLPADIEVLPMPEKLHGCTVAGVPEGVEKKNKSGTGASAGDTKVSPAPSRDGATTQPREPLSLDLQTGKLATLEKLKARGNGKREVFTL